MDLSTTVATIITIAIVLGVIIVLVLHRYYIELRKEKIKNHTIVFIYTVLFAMLAGAIVSILMIWGYDVTDFLTNILDQTIVVLENSVSKLVGSLIVIFVSMAVYKVGRVSLYKFGRRAGANQRRKITISKISLSILKYLLVIIGLLVILSVWGVNVGPALAGLGIMGIVIGFGAQKFINDLISGFFIVFEHHFDVGDWVEVSGFMGEVIDIGLKTTKIKNFKGEIKIFNNGSIDPVSNFSRTNSLAIVEFGIAYKEDIAKTIEILTKELPLMRQDFENMIEDPRIMGVSDLASSSVNIRAACLVKSMTQWAIERAMRQRIKEILVKHNIEIPFPQVVVHGVAQPKN